MMDVPHAEAVDCEKLLDRPFEMLTALTQMSSAGIPLRTIQEISW
ncbi:MAG: hypothetical protein ACYT04_32380 [Nostoc sp.]